MSIKIDNLDPILIQHPGERMILSVLEKKKILSKIISEYVDFLNRQFEVLIIGNGLHVTKESMPELYKLYMESCETLGVTQIPNLYLSDEPITNAFAAGADRAYINVTANLLFRLNPNEIKFILGHELGHIICGHTKYSTLVQWMVSLGSSNVPGAGLIKAGLDISARPLFSLWSRRSEYSADRAGLLASQDKDASYMAFLKMSGLPYGYEKKISPNAIIEQAREFQNIMNENLLDKCYGALNQIYASHPRNVERAAELKEWIDEGWYDEILNATNTERIRIANLLRKDPREAEFSMTIIRSLIQWAQKVLNKSRESIASPIRMAVFEGKSLDDTPVREIFKVEFSVIPVGSEKVKYEMSILYNKDGDIMRDIIELPMTESRDYIPDSLAAEFIRNGNEQINILIYELGE